MSSFSGQITSNNDAGEQGADNSSPGTVVLGGTSYKLKGSGGNDRYAAFRFTGVTIPQGATITAATISPWVGGSNAVSGLSIFCEAADDSAALTSSGSNISSRTKTTHSATWTGTLTANAFNTSPDFSAAVQDVVSLGGFASDALTVIFDDGVGQASNVAFEGFAGNASEAAAISITYTGGGSPPGAPTGLSLTYVSPTSLQANWTNPSGTLTDNKIQISTDDATWTTIDIGSVVTSYTFTGLTPNTLYYVQVAAVNSSGTGSYSYYAWWPTQATVSLETTLTLVGDLTNTGWTIVGSEPTCAATLNSTNDANYLIPPANTGQYLNMTLTGVPSNLITVTSAVVNARMKTTSGADTNSTTAAVGSLQLQITNALTTSIANYVSANLPLASQQGYAQWTAFTLEAFPFDVNQDNLIYRMSVTITYLAPPPVWPPVGFNNSIMNSCSMASFH